MNYVNRKKFYGLQLDSRFVSANSNQQADGNITAGTDWTSDGLYVPDNYAEHGALAIADEGRVDSMQATFECALSVDWALQKSISLFTQLTMGVLIAFIGFRSVDAQCVTGATTTVIENSDLFFNSLIEPNGGSNLDIGKVATTKVDPVIAAYRANAAAAQYSRVIARGRVLTGP